MYILQENDYYVLYCLYVLSRTKKLSGTYNEIEAHLFERYHVEIENEELSKILQKLRKEKLVEYKNKRYNSTEHANELLTNLKRSIDKLVFNNFRIGSFMI